MLGLNHNVGILIHPGFNDLGTAAAAVGIGSGLNSIFGGSSTPGSGTQAQSPWQLSGFGTEAAGILAGLMRGGPAGVATDPAYQAMQSQGQQAVQRGMAATGQTQSGNEQIALDQLSKGGMMDYWSKMVSTLGGLAGVQQGGQGAGTNAQIQQGGWQSLQQGLGGLNTIYGTPGGGGNTYTPAGYGGNDYSTSGFNLGSGM